jgi:predicted site-specific integrase-resolvase
MDTTKQEARKMTKRAAIYARVCVDDGHNLAEQVEACRAYAQDHELHIVAEFTDAGQGASGAAPTLPQLSRALELAGAGGLDVLVVRDAYRLSRTLPDLLRIEGELHDYGARIEYVLFDHGDRSAISLMKDYVRCLNAERNTRCNLRDRYLLRGRVVCGRCGQVMRRRTIYRKGTLGRNGYRYYQCEGHCQREMARRCDLPPFRADRVDAVVWDWIMQSLSESCAGAGHNLDVLACDIEAKRKIAQALGVQVTLVVEDGQKVAYVQSTLDHTTDTEFQVH